MQCCICGYKMEWCKTSLEYGFVVVVAIVPVRLAVVKRIRRVVVLRCT